MATKVSAILRAAQGLGPLRENGVAAMKKPSPKFLLALLVPAFSLVSVSAVVEAAPEAKATRWSDKATWPNHKVPVAGDKVTIPADKSVILDVSPPVLGNITIMGKLSFADKSDL